MSKLSFTLLLLMAADRVVQGQDDGSIVYQDCAADTYYSSLPASVESWTREAVRDLLTTTHRTVLPTFPTQEQPEDITEALIDLWPAFNDPEENIHMVYRNTEIPKRPANALESWTRESFWPEKRGAVRGTPVFTDVHQTAPADWTVLDDKTKLNPVLHIFFGECGTVNFPEACVSPANVETAADTAQDSKIYLPPANVRGDIARALFYTQVRYEEELGFMLGDCPPFSDTTFGYRSTLLKWHTEDPVDDVERARNDRACSRWQGNRNVFVDNPELVSVLFGEPDVIPAGMMQFSGCIAPTEGPTATPNECSGLIPGAISIYAFNSDNPDEIVFFPVENIPGSVGSLYLTDNAWDGTSLLDEEGTLEYKIPEAGIEAGEVFGYGVSFDTNADKGEWVLVDDSLFALHPDGDNMLLYCINADDEPHFISALSYAGPWVEAGLPSYELSQSALPDRLTPLGNTEVSGFPNWLYVGVQEANRDVLIPAFGNSSNWQGSDLRYEISGASFCSISLWGVAMATASLVLFVV